MCTSSNKYNINGRNLYVNKENNTIYIIPAPDDKPIKIVHDDIKVERDGNETLISKRLDKWEVEKLLMEWFGTTDVATLDCGNMTDEEINKIVDEFNSIPN